MANKEAMSKKAIIHLSKDEALKIAIDQVGEKLQLEIKDDLYLHLVRSIIGQQLSTKASQTIYGRFIALFNKNYPDPKQLMELPIETLRSVGLSRQKSGYVQNVAHHFLSNKLLKKDWNNHSDNEILDSLTQIKGVGTWTVQMILMFTLARPDILPIGDVGIQNAMRKLYDLEEKGKPLQLKMIELAEPWRPYRTYACYYLWRYLDV
jgi:DNA-3-methyladenine glycosylase II